MPKLIDESVHRDVPLTDEYVRKKVVEWIVENIDGSIGDLTPSNNLSSKISKYNIDKVGIEVEDLSMMLKEGELSSINKRLQNKELVEFLRNVK